MCVVPRGRANVQLRRDCAIGLDGSHDRSTRGREVVPAMTRSFDLMLHIQHQFNAMTHEP
jgi:hypothetical protein